MAEPIQLNDSDNSYTGTADKDTIYGNGGNDTIYGGEGRDSLFGGVGIDVLYGEGGDDYLDAGEGTPLNSYLQRIEGGDGNDTIRSGAYANMIGGDGKDDIVGTLFGNVEGGAGADILVGYDGFTGSTLDYLTSNAAVTINLGTNSASGGHADGDVISHFARVAGSAFDDKLTGSSDHNLMSGRDGKDSLKGLAGTDNLDGGAGNDTLDGGEDGDTLQGGAGADKLIGGGGIDTADYSSGTVGVTINLATGTASGGDAQGDTLSSIENVEGGNGNDSLTGNSKANDLKGGAGSDTLRGGGGNDTLHGGDSIYSNLPKDDELYGGDGNDALFADVGADRLDGGDGIDTAFVVGSIGLTVDLSSGTGKGDVAEGDIYVSIENVTTGYGDDSLVGSSAANSLNGSGGKDTIKGGGGNDTLAGAAGDDKLVGGNGNDELDGGDGGDKFDGGKGTDTVVYWDFSASVVVNLATNTGKGGTAEGDTFTSIEKITGGSGDDSLTGDSKANIFDGRFGNDTLKGGDGKDTLFGNFDDDSLDGGGGDDVLNGGYDMDRLKGGSGKDFFLFDTAPYSENIDTIVDFKPADDTIRLDKDVFTKLGAVGTTLAKAAFAENKSGEAADKSDRIIYETDTGKLFYDSDGTGSALAIQFAILTTKPDLARADFEIV